MKKGFSTGIAILVGLVLIGAVGYFTISKFCPSGGDYVPGVIPIGRTIGHRWQKCLANYHLGDKTTKPPIPIETQPPQNETANWKTYRNEQYGFEVRYDQNFFKEESSEEFLPPEYSKKVNGVKLIHSIPLKYCDARGQCLPETKNMATGFYALPNDFQDIIEPLKEFFGGGVEESIIAGKKGVMIHTGAEGEGRYYYFLPSHWIGQTLMITRDYIDERIMTSYQKAREFIPLAKQEEVFDKVTKTLIFAR